MTLTITQQEALFAATIRNITRADLIYLMTPELVQLANSAPLPSSKDHTPFCDMVHVALGFPLDLD